MKHVKKKLLILLAVIGGTAVGYFIIKLLPAFIFLFCMMTDDGGRLNNQELVRQMVIENQETLNETAVELLTQNPNVDIFIKEDHVNVLEGGQPSEPKTISDFNAEIHWLFQEKHVETIRIYSIDNIKIILFQTSSTGIVGSGKTLGFCYLEEGDREQIFQHYSLFPGKKTNYEEIMPKWFYYECLE